MFKSAAIEEVIDANPVIFERGVLPKKADKDPTWRHQAIYTRDEIELLISDERLLPDRRILYALKSVAALRHGEAANLRWSQYDSTAKPLGTINLGETKSGVPRAVPVHPTLAKLLATWKLSGWSAVYGRRPTPDDFIVPTRNMSEAKPLGTPRGANESQRQLVADLELLKLRTKAGKKQSRRGHGMRRTFITLARTDGAMTACSAGSRTGRRATCSTCTRRHRGPRSAPRSASSRSSCARARSSPWRIPAQAVG
jgi:integrase